MTTNPPSEPKPKSGKWLLTGFIIVLAVVLLIVAAPWILDYFSASEEQTGDSDSDGVPDELDVFPHDPSEWADNDKDGIGDNADIDDDNDDYLDDDDYYPSFDAALNISLISIRFLGTVDTPPFDDAPAEAFFIIYLDGEKLVTATPPLQKYWVVPIDTLFYLNWSMGPIDIPDNRATYDITIELYDQDIRQEQIDIDGQNTNDMALDIRYRLQSGHWSGDDAGTGTADGSQDQGGILEKDALLKFSVSTIPLKGE